MTPLEVARAAATAGITDPDALAIAVAIAGAESRWDPTAVGDQTLQDEVWGPSYGLWQIRSLWQEAGQQSTRDPNELAKADPAFNARSMATISSGGTNWAPWSTWTNGAYRTYLVEATAAARTALAERAGQVANVSPGRQALEIMRGLVGLTEDPPGSNSTPIGRYWGMDGVPWCALAVSYAYAKAGAPLPYLNGPGGLWSYVPTGATWARTYGETVADPTPGDIIIYSIGETESHTGLFDQWIVPGQTFWAIEGNTSNVDSDPNQTDGWYLARRQRHVNQVELWWHPAVATTDFAFQAAFAPTQLPLEDIVIHSATRRPSDYNGRPVYDITWLPADGTQLGSTKIHVAIVISPIDPGHAADASNPLLVDVYRASPDGTVALDRNVVVAPAGTPIGMGVHGRVSVVGDPGRPVNVIAREIAYV